MDRTGLPDVEGYMSIRGINNRGIDGYDVITRFTLDAQLEPLFTMEPKADMASKIQQTNFRWNRPVLARIYQLQLAAIDQFEQPLLYQSALRGEDFNLDQSLTPGKHYWWITAYNKKEKSDSMGHPQQFRTLLPAQSSIGTKINAG